ncbi:MAG: HAMP domain-containing sensor histidine kinase [Thermoguttaceae bacterium]
MSKRFLSIVPVILFSILGFLLLGFLMESQALENIFINRIGREVELSTKISAITIRDLLKNVDEEAVPNFVEKQLTPLLDENTRITVLKSDGVVLADSWENPKVMSNHSDRDEFIAVMEKFNPDHSGDSPDTTDFPCVSFQRYSTTTHQNMLYCITGFESNSGIYLVRTAVSVQSIDKMTRKIRRNIIVLSVFAMLLAVVLGYLLFTWFSQPLSKLSEAARKIASGASDTKLPSLRGDSLKQLAQTIYDMSDQLQNKITQLSQEKVIRDSIFDAMVEGVVLIDANGIIIEMNRAAAAILGTNETTARSRVLTAVWRNPEVEIFFNDLLEKNRVQNIQVKKEINFADDTKNICLTVEEINLKAQEKAFLLVLYDLTRMKKLETYRRDFVANLSHEIKTPLTVISGTVEALLDGVIDDKPRRDKFLNTLHTHSIRLTRLLEDVLSLANLECTPGSQSPDFYELPLAETVQVAVSLCKLRAEQRNMTLEFTDKTDNCVVSFSQKLIEQAVINLVDNAIKYSTPGDTIKIALERKNNDLLLIVEDHGRGIPLEHRERVFERFYRVDPSRDRQTGGTGLGLAIVKHIAQLHNGSVYTEPTSPTGATFIMRFSDVIK